ncbi:sulfatase-like protein [Plasmopara halstedii]|uniref:Sulfatase-like protein n=1 Tax=Plasmopara halstedii TaxID=4781 RepID=A0A0P1AKC9_PLAHL|nr:sulfatase-like protein [Plasmopara halstedii]CEG41703.1 sulfatase-like protein [Plasmopara halstedii]|eukprot:XP_024578072.1 sulfatase-like protein [Plasmopara halstedii]
MSERNSGKLGWGFVYTFTLFFLSVYRMVGLNALILMYANAEDGTWAVIFCILTLGFLEDLVCVTFLACTLWISDTLKNYLVTIGSHRVSSVKKIATFLISWFLFVAFTFPIVTDILIVRQRNMRFTFDMVIMAIQEQDNASAFEITSEEITDIFVNALVLVLAATVFAAVRTRSMWADLTRWNPTRMTWSRTNAYSYQPLSVKDQLGAFDEIDCNQKSSVAFKASSLQSTEAQDVDLVASNTFQYTTVDISDKSEHMDSPISSSCDDNDEVSLLMSHDTTSHLNKCESFRESLIAFCALVLLPMTVVALSCACSPLVAYSALNTTLNELFGHALQPNVDEFSSNVDDLNLPWVESYIHRETEKHELFGNDTLYRRTTGFKGPLAFDVKVNASNPPNVLLIVIESFRHHDSHYLVGSKDPSNLFNGSNITITPNFDKWAKRGIALRNYWSNWRTSRSVETLLFGQLPYDHVTKSGMTGGQKKTKLSGLPQLFTAKGYETFFTTGCKLHYDGWDAFLPTHGFDTVWGRNAMKVIAQSYLSINKSHWDGPEHRASRWGVHDDISFKILGDLVVNKTKIQAKRIANGKAKKPLFLTHYTISSHVNYNQRPKWYDEAKKPDFSALYKGQKNADLLKLYFEIRYFTDMEFGRFMDRMAKAGILNDTIVIISGDHGQSPEIGLKNPYIREVSTSRVAGAIVAEGRLGKAAGMVIDDAVEQYDMLNTLADITGLPDGGFEQDGVGRSIKRKVKFGSRPIYSNNPSRKMSVVRGHERLRYDKVTDWMMLHNIDTDHDMTKDLLPDLTDKKRAEWVSWRDAGRRINSYYTKRWEGKCLLEAECKK